MLEEAVAVRADAMVQVVEVPLYRAHAVAQPPFQEGELEAFRVEVVVPATRMEQALTAQFALSGPVTHGLTHQLLQAHRKVSGAINELTY
jgi:hypothetical protein